MFPPRIRLVSSASGTARSHKQHQRFFRMYFLCTTCKKKEKVSAQRVEHTPQSSQFIWFIIDKENGLL